jgi:hypothetical protein
MRDLLNKRYWPSPEVRLRVVGGEAIILDLASEEIFRLNETGTRVWQLLVEHHVPSAVLQILLEEHDVEEATLRDDMTGLVEQLLETGLITDREPSIKEA